MLTNESTLMLHTALSGSSTNQLEFNSTDPKDLFLIRLYSGPIVLKKLSLGKKGNFPLYPRQKLILLFFLLVKYHVIYGLALVRRVGLVWEPSIIMIRIYLFFQLGDLLLKLLIRSFYPPKSILRTHVPTIGSVRFLLLRNVTPLWWVLHWVLCGILMIPLLNGHLLQLRQVSISRPAYVVDCIQNPPLRSMDRI